ncbi:endopeptidase K [Apiospora saccharicola]
MRLLFVPLLAASAAFAAPLPGTTSPRKPPQQFTKEQAENGWIVVLKDDAPPSAFRRTTRDLAIAGFAGPRYTFDFGGPGALRGHVVSGPGSEIAVASMAESPYVDFIEPDTKLSLSDYEAPRGVHSGVVDRPTKSWGLHRLSHGPLTEGEPLEYRRNGTGRTGWVYIIDTGIALGHPEFGGRAKWGGTFIKGINESWIPDGGDDHGHGTHCAGIAGGSSLGVAQETNLVAVKVMDKWGGGMDSNLIRGLGWALKDATDHDRLDKSVISMSIGGLIKPGYLRTGKPNAVMLATRAASQKGVFVVAASGNDAIPAKKASPAAEPEVCTVSAIDRNDQPARFNNYGPEVDLLAPGVDILSAWPRNRTQKLDGTSMAAPFVAGLAAYFMDLDGPGSATPGRQMCERLKNLASYRKGVEDKETPQNFTDIKNQYTKVASNGWQLELEAE